MDDTLVTAIVRALQLLVLDRQIRAFLQAYDPKALAQVTRALDAAGLQSAPTDARELPSIVDWRGHPGVDAAGNLRPWPGDKAQQAARERMENTGTWMSPDILAIPPDPRLPVSDADAREEWAIDAAMALAAAGDAEPAVCGRPIDAAIVAPCEKPAGHAGPCRAFSLETGNSF